MHSRLQPFQFCSKKQVLYVRVDDSFGDISDLLKHSWSIYRVSPLFGYLESNTKLKQYGLQLKHFLARSGRANANAVYKAQFSVLENLKKTEDDSGALQIIVECSQDEKVFKVAYCGYFLRWDLNERPLDGEAVFFPLLLCRGRDYIRRVVHECLFEIFDCRITPYFLTTMQLLWMNGLFVTVSQGGKKNQEVSFCLSIPGSQKFGRIEMNIRLEHLHEIWKAIQERSSVLRSHEVCTFYEVILEHCKNIFPFYDLKELSLTEVKYPGIVIREDGKLKCSSEEIFNQLLFFLFSEICVEEDPEVPISICVE